MRERIAALEVRCNSIDAKLDGVAQDTRAVRERLNKQTGFVAGVSAAAALFWSVVVGTVFVIWDKVTGHGN